MILSNVTFIDGEQMLFQNISRKKQNILVDLLSRNFNICRQPLFWYLERPKLSKYLKKYISYIQNHHIITKCNKFICKMIDIQGNSNKVWEGCPLTMAWPCQNMNELGKCKVSPHSANLFPPEVILQSVCVCMGVRGGVWLTLLATNTNLH